MGAVIAPLQCPLFANEQAPDPDNVFDAVSRGRLGWNVAGAAEAKALTAMRHLCENKERSSQFRGALLTVEAVNGFGQ